MSDILDQICREKRVQIARQAEQEPFALMDKEARKALPPRGFARALRDRIQSGGVGLIAEIKKASPSAGMIRLDFSPKDLAQAYANAGATCLSVLTDELYFQGNNADLIEARTACAVPVLRKDFMLDVWQVAEARVIGADCILLIMAALADNTARDLHAAATDYGMDVLIEVHNREELDRALLLPSGLIGINNRNLNTLETNIKVTYELRSLIPNDRVVVSESGISSAKEIASLRGNGVHCFLVGESLLKQKDVGAATKALIAL